MSGSVDDKPVKVRIDYEKNHGKISRAFKKLAGKTSEVPTYEEIGAECGLTKETVYRHFKDYKLQDYKDKFKPLTPDIIFSLYRMAVKKNNPRAAELFMKMIEDYSDKSTIDVNIRDKVTGFNYIEPGDDVQDAEIIED